jgi:hypothetical protein
VEQSTTQARLFAAEYAKNTASQVLETINQSAKRAGWVTMIALTVSMPHQIGFILGLAPLSWTNINTSLESATLILGAVGIPVAVDLLILICIQGLATRAIANRVKRATMMVMLFPIGVSGTVNFMAPAPLLIKLLFVVAVVLIPLAEGRRAAFLGGPDFSKVEKMETEITGQLADQIPVQSRRCEPGCTCGRHTPQRRRRGRRGRGKSPVEQIENLESVAPVSPAV